MMSNLTQIISDALGIYNIQESLPFISRLILRYLHYERKNEELRVAEQ